MITQARDITQGHLRENSEELPFLADTASSKIKTSEQQNPSSSECFALKVTSDSTRQDANVPDVSKMLLSKNNNILQTDNQVIGCNTSVDDTQTSKINNRLSV